MLIGSYLAANIKVKEVCILAVIVIVLLFIPFTIYAMGSDGITNCGCFGAISILNTDNQLLNLVKNILLIIGLSLTFISQANKNFSYQSLIIGSLLFITPIFIYNYTQLPDKLSYIEFVELQHYINNTDEYILVDARDHSTYLQSHIPSAISVPYIGNATDLAKLDVILSSNDN